MAITVREVAAEAGVSFQLVAAVLGQKKYAHASQRTREKIFSAAERLGYVPNANARILRGEASKLIGVLIDSKAPEVMYDILSEMVQAADRCGYRILTAQAHDQPEKLMQSYHSLKQNGVDGIISFSHDYSQFDFHLDESLKEDPRIVYVLNTHKENQSAVDVAFQNGIARAVCHLQENRFRKTALVLTGDGNSGKYPMSCRKRIEGFENSCPEGKILHVHATLADIPLLEKGCLSLVREVLISEGFDSVIAQTDVLAVTLINQLIRSGKRVPEDFGVIGCDNLPLGETYPVKLSTLCYDRKGIADSALEALLERINGNSAPCRKELPVNLIIRDSSVRK